MYIQIRLITFKVILVSFFYMFMFKYYNYARSNYDHATLCCYCAISPNSTSKFFIILSRKEEAFFCYYSRENIILVYFVNNNLLFGYYSCKKIINFICVNNRYSLLIFTLLFHFNEIA